MLRVLLVLLLLANLGFYAWSHGLLEGVVSAPPNQREPERLRDQVRPEAIRLPGETPRPGAALQLPGAGLQPAVAADTGATSAALTGAASAAAAITTACLESGHFTEAEFTTARAVLRTQLPADAWRPILHEKAGVFMLYLGRFPTRDAMQRRQAELRPLGVKAEEVLNSPGFEFGLSLGRYTDKREAEAGLAALQGKGLRAARLVTITPPVLTYSVRVPAADEALQSQLQTLKPRLNGRGFSACRVGTAA
ncbi:hypothetical protein OOT46_02215 [Aquabacterium sp. A7-Y]|uniref:hypothetical protein n=1 Tax=Aquabacterium sp. A7-Y TaxID=1349605 RepID=UPI00223D4705|nr:hypothetical protein [Aquabacterium sp. A7-Y]MCW7536672.1 hypothetical protein [Aquabacterium sp. A7-Y]